VARDIVQELESFGDPSSVVTSSKRQLLPSLWNPDLALGRVRSGSSSSSGSTTSERPVTRSIPSPHQPRATSEEGRTTDEEHLPQAATAASEVQRPRSSMSSQIRYRTPLAGSMIAGGPQGGEPQQILGHFSPTATPAMQPLPEYPTPSAFASSDSPSYPTSNITYPRSASQSPQLPYNSVPFVATPPFQRSFIPGRPPQTARSPMPTSAAPHASSSSLLGSNRPPLERAMENMQASIAALHERIEALERFAAAGQGRGSASSSSLHDSRRWSGHISPSARPHVYKWDPSNMGFWSFLLQPLARLQHNLQYFVAFLTNPDARATGPVLMVVRRLLLDATFVLFVAWALRLGWRGTRDWRKDLLDAWRHVRTGKGKRILVDKGV
jgi:hypothetical protein